MNGHSSDFEDLLFQVRISRRYHNKRRGFLEAVNRSASALAIIVGSAAATAIFAGVFSPILVMLAFISAVLSSLDLAFGVGAKAALHSELWRRFTNLEQQMLGGNYNAIIAFRQERLSIESDEPAELRVLTNLCYNEQCVSEGMEQRDQVHIKWYQRLFANVFDVRPDSIRNDRDAE